VAEYPCFLPEGCRGVAASGETTTWWRGLFRRRPVPTKEAPEVRGPEYAGLRMLDAEVWLHPGWERGGCGVRSEVAGFDRAPARATAGLVAPLVDPEASGRRLSGVGDCYKYPVWVRLPACLRGSSLYCSFSPALCGEVMIFAPPGALRVGGVFCAAAGFSLRSETRRWAVRDRPERRVKSGLGAVWVPRLRARMARPTSGSRSLGGECVSGAGAGMG
jgi:hypothetical protein